MSQPDPEQLMIHKNLVRGGLAAAAPGLPVLVVAFTVEPVDLLQMAGLASLAWWAWPWCCSPWATCSERPAGGPAFPA